MDVKVELLINNQKIEQKSVNESTRSLGVYIIPSLNWKGQFIIIYEKMEEVAGRLKNVNIYSALIHIYFNVYFVMKVYFGYGIISISNI